MRGLAPVDALVSSLVITQVRLTAPGRRDQRACLQVRGRRRNQAGSRSCSRNDAETGVGWSFLADKASAEVVVRFWRAGTGAMLGVPGRGLER